jgi:hypothetical protein
MGSVLLNHWLCLIIDMSVCWLPCIVEAHEHPDWNLQALSPRVTPHTLAGYEVHNMLSNEVVG